MGQLIWGLVVDLNIERCENKILNFMESWAAILGCFQVEGALIEFG